MNSKERFLEVALDLFSKNGYAGVSVRDIAKVLGMRESAMYKHFTSKAKILEEITLRAKEKLEMFQSEIIYADQTTKQVVTTIFLKLFDFYVADEFMNKFRKIMIISQYENEESKLRYNEMFLEKSLRYYERIFTDVALAKGVHEANPKLMAYELYSVLFLLMQQYDSQNDRKQIANAKEILKEHIELFLTRFSFLEG